MDRSQVMLLVTYVSDCVFGLFDDYLLLFDYAVFGFLDSYPISKLLSG